MRPKKAQSSPGSCTPPPPAEEAVLSEQQGLVAKLHKGKGNATELEFYEKTATYSTSTLVSFSTSDNRILLWIDFIV